MGRYVARRVLQGVITLYLISLTVFVMLRVGGGNPIAHMLPPDATALEMELMTKALRFRQACSLSILDLQ